MLDDVICEIGFHRMFIEGSWEKARLSFNEVINNYPNRNAYDNALWWYGIGMKNAGNFTQAIPAFAKIGALEVQSRFRRWSSDEGEKLTRLIHLEPFTHISFQSNKLGDSGLFIKSIKSQSLFTNSLLKGDRLLNLCGKGINKVDDLLRMSEENNILFCDIEFLRGNALLRLTQTQDGKWLVDKRVLTEKQLENIALQIKYLSILNDVQ